MRTLLATAVAALALTACAPTKGHAPDPARGARLAVSLGCADCHTPGFTGHKVSKDDTVAVLYSANLTRAVAGYTDAQLRHVLTTGQRPDGSRLWFMDAAPYAVLSDPDMADLIAYLRTLAPAGQPHPRLTTSPRFDAMVRSGALHPESTTLAEDLANPPRAIGPETERGRYLARTACAGCHAPSLRGFPDDGPGAPPDLAVAAAYARADFHTLLKTGQGPGGRAVGEMSDAARKRFSGLPAADVDALYDYLVAWAAHRDAPPAP